MTNRRNSSLSMLAGMAVLLGIFAGCASTVTNPADSISDSPENGGSEPAGLNSLITDPNAVVTPFLLVSKPAYLSPIVDPTFGTQIIRIAGDAGTSFTFSDGASGSGTWGNVARHHYSKDQPWNIDQSMLVLENRSPGSPSFVVLDGSTYRPLKKCSYSGEDRWHPLLKNIRINVPGGSAKKLEWRDLSKQGCPVDRSWTLPSGFTASWFGQFEGNPSFDGRYIALVDTGLTRMVVVDMNSYPALRITQTPIDISWPNSGVNWVSVSPSGKYAVVQYDNNVSPDALRVFDVHADLSMTARDFTASNPLECAPYSASNGFIMSLGHADMTLNPFDNNEDVIIGQLADGDGWGCPLSLNGVRMGHVVMVRLRDGQVTSLTHDYYTEAYAHHISTRNLSRPGWVYVGYFPVEGKRYADEVIALKIDGSGTVERLAHKHSDTPDCYLCETHAVPSPDGTRAVFASNWAINCPNGGCGSADKANPVVQDYVIDTRTPAPTPTPTSTPTSTPTPTPSPTPTPTSTPTPTWRSGPFGPPAAELQPVRPTRLPAEM